MNFNFNNGKERLKKGIYLASSSFMLLWKHKILSFYLAVTIGTLLFFTVEILALSFETIFTTAVYQYIHDKPSGPFNVELIKTQMKIQPNQ